MIDHLAWAENALLTIFTAVSAELEHIQSFNLRHQALASVCPCPLILC